jgi:hypothetical protein
VALWNVKQEEAVSYMCFLDFEWQRVLRSECHLQERPTSDFRASWLVRFSVLWYVYENAFLCCVWA